MTPNGGSRYNALIEKIFFDRYTTGLEVVPFSREDFSSTAHSLGIALPKNIGDVVYSFRHRKPLPDSVSATAPAGFQWVISGTGIGNYKFELLTASRVVPNNSLLAIKIPDATPQIIIRYAKSDEQALLARLRYNRLVDLFLALTSYSLQNHLRTTVTGIGQIEIDEIYVGINQSGAHFIIPVQAKTGRDQIGIVQTKQDLAYCAEKYPDLIARAVSAQFLQDDVIAMFELVVVNQEVKAISERHFQLVPSDQISDEDLAIYRTQSGSTN
jgi:hypothetical protein